MHTDSKQPLICALLAVIFLLPSVLTLIASLSLLTGVINVYQAIQLYGTGDPKLMAGALSQELVTQTLAVIVLIPGIIFACFAKYKYNYSQAWYRITLRIYGICLLFLLPFGTLIGVFLLTITKKTHQSN